MVSFTRLSRESTLISDREQLQETAKGKGWGRRTGWVRLGEGTGRRKGNEDRNGTEQEDLSADDQGPFLL